MNEGKSKNRQMHQELSTEHHDPLIRGLHSIVRVCIKVLAVLMVTVILWSVADVFYVMYLRLMAPPFMLLDINDIFKIFGAFMAVLIAIEIFINIRLYLGSNTLPVKLVIATALMAIARKVIILDLDNISPQYILAIAAVVLALGITYWLINKSGKTRTS